MHCPLCGFELEQHSSVSQERIDELNKKPDEKLSDKEWDELEGIHPKYGRAVLCTCPKGCFKLDFPILYHRYDNRFERPGDSWSLTWIK